jgi:hypothetical protein
MKVAYITLDPLRYPRVRKLPMVSESVETSSFK